MINRGSEWHRWEPHIHGPGTILNNQFGSPKSWPDYLSALEAARPLIEAVAVTDYYVTDTYERILEEKASGRLPAVELVFPNVELRLDVATARAGFVNLHLFVSPQDQDHIEQLQRLLARLHFRAFDDRYDCTRSELIRLGKRVNSSIASDAAALSEGANQFKINFNELRDVIGQIDWAKKNILIGVAGGATDGTAGIREAADQTIRAEIEKFADIIFASSSAQREFWLGERALTADQIRERYDGLKPCLHGSDAHKLADVGLPFGDRFSWIKGALEFDSLRQACIEPAGRAFVGPEPPPSGTPSQIIASIRVSDAPWLQTPDIPLNSGLIAIIGARGSGKTALADIIAAGCDAIPLETWEEHPQTSASFLARARSLIGRASVEVRWQAGAASTRLLDGSDSNGPSSYARVRYLSQRFVEDLCSSSGLSDRLLEEIERVIFEAHPMETRDGAIDFAELLEERSQRYRLARQREAQAVAQISDHIATELEKERLVESYTSQVAQKTALIGNYTADRTRLIPKGADVRVARHTAVAAAVESVRANVRARTGQRQIFLTMRDEVKDLRLNQAPDDLRQMQARYRASGMNENQWADFLLDYKGNVDEALTGYIAWADGKISELKGTAPQKHDDSVTYISSDADLSKLPLTLLEAEMGRLEKLVSADTQIRRQYSALTSKITAESAALETLRQKLIDANGARDRARQLLQDREAAYQRAFEAIIAEQTVLEQLYRPLMERLRAASGTLQNLSFSVERVADVQRWATEAEDNLIDLRKQGSFKGRGTLFQRANEVMRTAWEQGSATDVSAAMTEFRRLYQNELLEHSPVSRSDQAEFRAWSKRFAQWLFSTEHIEIRYGIEYDGVDIRKLSPGTRGIVLLLLYLALDDADDRPLIIDQPEENLDPKSVFDELVGLFIQAKLKRQVIMVTHNANLVINTDADQIIIAEAGPHPQGALPPITYRAGGLENAEIRKAVCDILEGGEAAFKERARRLRVRLDR
jgi:energy-coupling factor transporter ATP-binding protein EcfA2